MVAFGYLEEMPAMPQPVKISDALMEAARSAADLTHRSVAAQVEHWATLGRAIEGQLTAQQSSELVRSVREAQATYGAPPNVSFAERLADAMVSARDGTFSRRMRDELHHSERTLYGTHPDFPGKLVRRSPDGSLTPGQLVGRQFVADDGLTPPLNPKP
jgi:hypothetical protein